MPGQASVNVVGHAGRILALGEVGLPWRLGTELETVEEYTFGGALDTNMTAHPKLDPVTGEMVFFGYDFGDHAHYHVADASGRLVHSADITVRPSMMHDFGVTATRSIFMDLPVLFSLDAISAGRMMPFAWDGEAGARLGVLPRHGADADVVWIDIEPCYVFHVVNAHDDGDLVVMDVIRYPAMFQTDLLGPDEPQQGSLVRWVIDPAARTVSSTVLDDRPSEFPRVDPRRETLPHRYSYRVGLFGGSSALDAHAIVKWDHHDDTERRHDFGPTRLPGEGIVVPAGPDAAEGDGWIMTVVYDTESGLSDVVVLDAAHVEADPVATVGLPVRVPFGFHGNWIPED
jgi:carotenoid cleavage dioxygenase